LVQTTAQVASSKVDSLKKDFAKLQNQLQAGAEITPGVKDTIDKLIKMVDDEIEPAIMEAHKADQEMLEADHTALVDLNEAYVGNRDALLADAASIRADQTSYNTNVGEWKAATEAYTLAAQVYTATYDHMNDICCQKDNAGVLDVVYTPAYYACDFSNDDTADNCITDADTSIAGLTVDHFSAGKTKYDDLFAKCNKLKDDFQLATTDLDNKDQACDGERDDTKNLEQKIAADRSTFDPLWAVTVSNYNGNWTQLLNAFDGTVSRVHHDEADRKDEWKSTQEIECMLKAYMRSGTFDNDELDSCNRDVTMTHLDNIYPTAPAKEHTVLPAWVEMDSYEDFKAVCEPANAPVLQAFTCTVASPKPFPSCTNHVA
jgi:hypothetical protein